MSFIVIFWNRLGVFSRSANIPRMHTVSEIFFGDCGNKTLSFFRTSWLVLTRSTSGCNDNQTGFEVEFPRAKKVNKISIQVEIGFNRYLERLKLKSIDTLKDGNWNQYILGDIDGGLILCFDLLCGTLPTSISPSENKDKCVIKYISNMIGS